MKPISARSLTGERCRAALAGGAPSSSRPAPCSTRRSSTPHSQALPGVRACGVYCLAPSHRPGYTSTAHIRQCLADTFCEVSTHGGAGVVRPSEPDRGVGSKTQPRPENERGGLAQSTARQRTARQTPARAARCPPPLACYARRQTWRTPASTAAEQRPAWQFKFVGRSMVHQARGQAGKEAGAAGRAHGRRQCWIGGSSPTGRCELVLCVL